MHNILCIRTYIRAVLNNGNKTSSMQVVRFFLGHSVLQHNGEAGRFATHNAEGKKKKMRRQIASYVGTFLALVTVTPSSSSSNFIRNSRHAMMQ